LRFQGNESSEELSYLDAVAREWASEPCVRCSQSPSWKTAAMVYEGLEWKYYYCYECRRWFRRHFRYRYAIEHVNDAQVVDLLVRNLESKREALDAQLATLSWFKRKLSAASIFFQRFIP
jgi:hypothetical protein